MNELSRIASEPGFRAALAAGRGTAPVLAVYRGTTRGATAEDGVDGAGVDGLERCLDRVAEAVGLPIAEANVFCSEARTTLTAQFALPDAAADLNVYHDTVTGETTAQILHERPVSVGYASRVELLRATGDPWRVLEARFGDAAEGVARVLRRLGLRPSRPAPSTGVFETHVLEIEDDEGRAA